MLDKLFIEEDEIDYKAVFKDPLRWFGFIYPYFLIMLVAGGMFWVFNMGNSYLNTVPVTIHASHAADESNMALVNEVVAKYSATTVHSSDQINNISAKIEDDNSQAATLFKNNVNDVNKALYLLGSNNRWRTEAAQFVNLVSSSIPDNGFKATIVALPKSEIELLLNYLNGLLPQGHTAQNDEL